MLKVGYFLLGFVTAIVLIALALNIYFDNKDRGK